MLFRSPAQARSRNSHRRTSLAESLEIRSLLSAISPLKPVAPLPYAPGEVLIQYHTNANANPQLQTAASRLGTVIENLHTSASINAASNISRIQLNPGVSVEQAVAELMTDPSVAVAEPNWILHSFAESNDPNYTAGSTWGVYSSDTPTPAGPVGTTNLYASQAEQAWRTNVTGSASVIVGIIDEGVQITHPDLADNIWVNPFETPADGIDNDGNGFIDDVNGWDFFNNDNTVSPVNGESHGTHVSGIIGASGGNSIGGAGVAWDVTIIPVKFMQAGSGTVSNAIKAIKYLNDLKARHGLNIVASNNSWGSKVYSSLLHDAVISAAKQEILVVAAAGNSATNNDSSPVYPANLNTTVSAGLQSPATYDAVISVANLTQTGALSSSSNFGASSVDIAAPGESILSTVPSGYGTKSGTSMAAPHVAGAIALFASAQPGRVPADLIRSAILTGADPTSALASKTLNSGRLNIAKSLQFNASIQIDQNIYGPGQLVSISVAGTSANQNNSYPDTLAVEVFSTTESTPLSITLTETGPNTGLFRGVAQLALGTPNPDQLLQVAHGDVITARLPNSTLSDTATVDAVAPAVSNILATPAGASAGITWTNSESATAVIRFGSSPLQLDRSFIVTTSSINANTTLHALNASSTYYFQIESIDPYGNSTLTATHSFTTNSPAPILFIDDDQNFTLDTYYRNSLNANAFAFDEWNVSKGARLPAADNLMIYPLVIWNTGSDVEAPDAGLSLPEQEAIAAYLDNGGRIFISGQDILYNTVSDEFLRNYLKIDSFVEDVVAGPHTETGVVGNPISEGLTIASVNTSGYPGIFVDAIQPVPGANGLLRHSNSASPFPFSSLCYRGDYANGGFGLVFSTVPFETLSRIAAAPNNQTEVLRRIINFLNSPVDHGFQFSPPANPITTEGGDTATFTIRLLTQPSDNVVIPINSSNSSEGNPLANSVVFTSANWNVPQTIQVAGVDDFIDDGDINWTAILEAAVSSDPNYNALNPPDVNLTNLDNDTAGISVSPISDTTTSESGTSVTFTVTLNSQPLANVNLAVSSSDLTEAAVDSTGLSFTPANWNQPQTIVVTGLDDTLYDGTIAYSIILAPSTSDDPLYHTLNPNDFNLVNTDNDVMPPTKFFVVDDNSVDQTFEYDANGGLNENYPVNTLNSAPRGVATIAAANRIWVLDASRMVYVYNDAGALLGSWKANLLYTTSDVQGIATDGINIWIIDRLTDRIYLFADAASRLSDEQTYTRHWLVNRSNGSATDIVYGAQNGVRYLWTVDDTAVDRVFRYTLTSTNSTSSTAVSWQLDSINSSPTGITLDPSNGSMDIWISDSSTDRVYRYANARNLTTPILTSSFSLDPANSQPQGIADPPPPATENSLPGFKREFPATRQLSANSPPLTPPPVRTPALLPRNIRTDNLATPPHTHATNTPVTKNTTTRTSYPVPAPPQAPQNAGQLPPLSPRMPSLFTNTSQLDLLFSDPSQFQLL